MGETSGKMNEPEEQARTRRAAHNIRSLKFGRYGVWPTSSRVGRGSVQGPIDTPYGATVVAHCVQKHGQGKGSEASEYILTIKPADTDDLNASVLLDALAHQLAELVNRKIGSAEGQAARFAAEQARGQVTSLSIDGHHHEGWALRVDHGVGVACRLGDRMILWLAMGTQAPPESIITADMSALLLPA
ncbi:hypothetical protein [Psychromicrobium xiongbiense]|uniref:hypothetical protein n=1 Tax=Psychromicrobium xiongbiense TaxID=3051184 RepID=UPI002557C438|nr:hypothetical protein [Psychromicrobium sp. YIM S02556]